MNAIAWLKASSLTLVVLVLTASAVQAAQLHLDLKYLGSVDEGFNRVPDEIFAAPMPSPGGVSSAHFHNFGVFMLLTDTLPDEDFWAVQFDIDLGPGLVPADFGGFTQWTANNPLYDPNGLLPPPATPLFSDNADIGTSDHDLIRIFAQVASATQALNHMGEPNQNLQIGPLPFRLGDFWVQWDQSLPGALDTYLRIAPNGEHPWGTFVGGATNPLPASSFTGDTFSIHVPEPAGLVLFTLAALSLLGLVRRC